MITSIILIVIGIAFIAGGNLRDKKYKKLLKTGKQADGVIFELATTHQGNIDYPVIRFVTDKQEWITKTADIALSSFKEGDKVTVLYNPANPDDFTIKSATSSLINPLFIIIGALLVVAGIAVFLFPRLMQH